MSHRCNQQSCLRKYRENSESEISDYCWLYAFYFNKNKIDRVLNSKECPYYCDKFFCYETKQEVTKHEDTFYISSDLDLKHSRGKFWGLSIEGSKIQEDREQWENKHENENSTICPYCDYEFKGWEDDCEEMEDEETKCGSCGKTFLRTIEAKYSYSTKKLEEYEEEHREDLDSPW